jgi:hypothetical protein
MPVFSDIENILREYGITAQHTTVENSMVLIVMSFLALKRQFLNASKAVYSLSRIPVDAAMI